MEYLADWNDIGNLLRDQQGNFRNTYDVLNDLAQNYEPVWEGEERITGWKPKAGIYARGGRANVVFADFIFNCGDNAFEWLKPVERRGLYDLCINNHIDIPESISKDSPCYKQFMKELEGK